MISVKKDFNLLPDKLDTDKRIALIKDALLQKNQHNFELKVYRNGTLETLESENLYNKKCAYCETNTSAGAPMQVEHYRPKKAVTEDQAHEGYYWIAYEWSNLLLSCSKCNNKKRNRFPIEGTRVRTAQIGADGLPEIDYRIVNSDIFRSEKALLLNPEIDEVEKHFIFLPNGEIEALTTQGTITIEVCDLNRKDLVLKRLSIVNYYLDKIQAIIRDLLVKEINIDTFKYNLKDILTEILSLQKKRNEYSRFGYFMFVMFNAFFLERLENKQRKLVETYFELFLKRKL